MKENWLKRIIIGLLVSGIMSVATFAQEPIAVNKITRADLKLSEMKYEHIEYSEVEKLLNELEQIIAQTDEEAFYKWDETYYDLYYKISTMIQIAQLNYQLHKNQSEYFDEYLYSVDLLGKMKSDYIEIFEEEEKTLSNDMTKFYELTIERSKLVDEYLEAELSTLIEVDGGEMTFIELLQDTSLNNEQFYKLYDQWYTAYNQVVGEILLQLVQLDNQMAKIQGYDTYVESMYHNYERDYTPKEIATFITHVKEVVPDLFNLLYKSNVAATTILEQYTYEGEENLLESIDEGFISKHSDLKEAYDYMCQYELYDIEYRQDKENGGFTTYFDQFAEPYIVINYGAEYETALTFIHEFGHYFSYYKIGTNMGGLDLDETYSQGLELIAMAYYNEIFQDDYYSKAAKIYTIENMLGAIIQGCLYDEFLQEIYANPNITVGEMNKLYGKLAKSYGIKVDDRSWCMVPHNFQSPFYYISYSVSAVAALEIWAESLEQEEAGINTYLALVEAGREHSFIDSLKVVGLSNPLEKETLEEVVDAVKQYFGKKHKPQEQKNAA
ncbi:MAG: hypothetical protein E7231_13575 [Cellulosilyticum sp.]|nr:hypothetical protein [Cellulosilyticum sp.]